MKTIPLDTLPKEMATTLITREDFKDTDVVLGVGGYDRGLYRECLADWWQKYEAASHSTKRDVCKKCVHDMHKRGIRFLFKVENGTKAGGYVLEPPTSMKIHKKVLRALRSEVINRLELLSPKEIKEHESKIRKERKKNSKAKKDDSLWVPLGIKAPRPTGPSVTPEKTLNVELTVKKDPSIVPPPPPPPPPPVQCHPSHSSGMQSLIPPYIPSALNWGTSDLVIPRPHQGQEDSAPASSMEMPKLTRQFSVDLSKVFDEAVPGPPLLRSQSSAFSAADWFNFANGAFDFADPHVDPSKSSDREVSSHTWKPLDESIFDESIGSKCVSPDHHRMGSITPVTFVNNDNPVTPTRRISFKTEAPTKTAASNKRSYRSMQYNQLTKKLNDLSDEIRRAEEKAKDCQLKSDELWKELLTRLPRKRVKREN